MTGWDERGVPRAPHLRAVNATIAPRHNTWTAYAVDVPTWALFAWWWVFALTHARERLLADGSYYVFKALCAHRPWVEHERWALAFPELPSLVASWMHLPMSAVVMAFSIALPLFTTLAYVLIRWRWRVPTAGLLTVFPFLASLSAAHFSPLFELYFGVVALGVWWVMPSTSRALRMARALLFLLGASSHPSGPFLGLFCVLLDRLLRPERMPWRSVAGWVSLAVLAALPGRIAPSAYEQEKTRQLSLFLHNSSGEELVRWFRDYLHWTWEQHPATCITLVAMLGFLAWRKGALALGVAVAAVLALLVLLYLESPFPSPSRYQEQIQFPLVLCTCWLVAALWDQERWPRWIGLGGLCVAAVLSIRKALDLAPRFGERIAIMERTIERAKAQGLAKVEVPAAELTGPGGMDPNWSYGLESLFLSTAYHGTPITIIPTEYGPTLNGGAGPGPDEFVVRDGVVMPLRDLPAPWSALPGGAYVPLERTP